MMKKLYALLIVSVFCLPGFQYAQTVSITQEPHGTSPNIVFGTLAFHASEYIYFDSEIGAGAFTSTPIDRIGFNVQTLGAPTSFSNVNIYMQNTANTVFATGTYTTAGYTLVYSGSVTLGATGFNTIDLQTPFLRTAGSNLQVLVTRADGAAHTGYIYGASFDDPTGTFATTISRRYNGATAATPGVTSLTASTFRASIQLIRTLATDAALTGGNIPNLATCVSGPQTIGIEVTNNGTNAIAAGAASVTVNIAGTVNYTNTIANSILLAPGASQTLDFSGINLGTVGESDFEAHVTLAGDGDQTNDSLFTLLSYNNITNFPITDDIEGTELTITPFVDVIAGDRQLWSLHSEDAAFINVDMSDSLPAYSGNSFLFFDAYSGANSVGVQGRLFSSCLGLGNPPAGGSCSSSLSFFMSHDTTFLTPNFNDSLYVSVSTDQGNTWNRIAGFRRLDNAFAVPGWRQEIIDLTPYNGSDIQIGFEGVSDWGNIIGLDDIQIISNCVVPVTLGSFTVQKQNKANRLSWTTTQEINAMRFVVQLSRNGRDFVSLGEVAAAGSSNTERTYSFTHNLPSKGYNYYRIKMVDRDNRSKYSEVRSVQNLGVNQVQVTPNPVANTMKVSINAETSDVATIMITDMSGKAISSKNFNVTAGDNDIPVNTAGLASGSYIVRVQLNGDVQVSKFIKL